MHPFFQKKVTNLCVCMYVLYAYACVCAHIGVTNTEVELYNSSGSQMVPAMPFHNQYPLSPRYP